MVAIMQDGPRWDPRGPQLVYRMIADDIAAKIADGTYPPGSRLPSEQDLAAQYGSAKMTVRRAIRQLQEQGLVMAVWGKGTFVVPQGDAGGNELHE